MGGPLDPLTPYVFLTQWQANWGWNVALAVLLIGYLWGWTQARRKDPSAVRVWRAAMFVIGIAVLVVCFNSVLETYSHVLFWVHMIQHLILIMLAPALWILGSPLTVLTTATGGATGRAARAVKSWPASVLLFPLTGLVIYTVIIVGTHLTSFMDKMVQHMWLHNAEAVLYLVGGMIFFWSLIGNEPIRWQLPHPMRMVVLFVAMAPDTVVGIVLMQSTHVMFPAYAANQPAWGPGPMQDLYAGGAIMWVFGDMLMMCFLLGVTAAWLAHPSQNATAGSWLEGVRRSTMTSHVASATGDDSAITDSADLDDDEAALEAYNEMLRKLSEKQKEEARRRGE